MCTICDLRIEFSISHPMALAVAVATRAAIETGILPARTDLDDPLGSMRLRLRAIEALKAAQRRIEQTRTRGELVTLPDFFVLMVESRTWGFFHPTMAGFDPNCRPEAPRVSEANAADRDAVVVVTETAMDQIVAGKLPFAAAVTGGLVVIDADEDRRETLSTAWDAAYPTVGFSRFVCA